MAGVAIEGSCSPTCEDQGRPKRKGKNGEVGGSRKRKPRRVAQKKERSLKKGEIALVNAEFVEDRAKWKVLAVDWSDDDRSMVVWYCDIEAADMEEEGGDVDRRQSLRDGCSRVLICFREEEVD